MDDAAPRDLAPGTLPRPRTVLAADALHRFWRERMREAPSVDHALAWLLSGLELEALRRAVTS